jgi:micrococcal nuclease
MKKGMNILFLIIIILLLIAINYNSLDTFVVKKISNEEFVQVERVIDGDTVVVNGTSVRMLGINTPERGEKYYSEAKNYTSSLVLNKTIKIERRGKDLYDRDLAYLFYNNENLNVKLVEVGYANYYFPEKKDGYYQLFTQAWERCILSNWNLCKKSSDKCADCIIVKDFGYDENLILYNLCTFDCNLTSWSVKDEGRKKFIFKNFILKSDNQIKITPEDFKQEYVWTNTGDTMFLRDYKGELVLWEGY